MEIRKVKVSDYYLISSLINDWWDGRHMSDMLPKLFFVHFADTSFIAEENGEIIGFLIGFLSQTDEDAAYIHFVGVEPNHRQRQIGKSLYHEFFTVIEMHGRKNIQAVTSPVNKVSIAYHTKMGFNIKNGDKEIDGISVFSDYDGKNQDRVLFVKNL